MNASHMGNTMDVGAAELHARRRNEVYADELLLKTEIAKNEAAQGKELSKHVQNLDEPHSTL
jgi:hypothetical protein